MRDRSYLVVVVVLAAAMFGGLRFTMESARRSALAEAEGLSNAQVGAGGPSAVRPLDQTARLLRDMKIVTVEILAEVESLRTDDSWRGDVRARVVAPVRLLYGCDLTGVSESGPIGLRRNLLTDGYTLRVPSPRRIATEIDGQAARGDVTVGWARFRDLAGEYQLGLARSGLYEEARAMLLTHAQARQVEQTTREQLIALVRAFAAGGEPVPVEVEFIDTDPRDHPVVGADEQGERGPAR